MMIVASNSITISNVTDGKTPYLHTAWSWSADGSDRFMTGYPNENLIPNTLLNDNTGWAYSQQIGGSATYGANNGSIWIDGSAGTVQNALYKQWETAYSASDKGNTFNYLISLQGRNVSISVDVEIDEFTQSGTNAVSISLRDNTGRNIARIDVPKGSVQTGKSVRYSTTKTLPDDVSKLTRFRVILATYTDGLTKFSKPKFEVSDVATPYTPTADEDYQAAYPTYRGEYTDFTQSDSTNYKDYKWVRVLGEAGGEGPAGKDSHTHIAYANSADGKTDFSVADSNRDYVGMYWDYEDAASNDPTKYKWTKTKGIDGKQGIPGPVGPNGLNSQFHQAWADSSDGKAGFSTTVSLGKKYLGTYTDYVEADSTDPTKYKWTELVGAVEIGGRNLVLNSLDLSKFSTWQQESGVKPTVSDDGTEMTITSAHGGLNINMNNLSSTLPFAGATVTLSVDVKGGEKVELNYRSNGAYYRTVQLPTTADWVRYSTQFVWQEGGDLTTGDGFVIYTRASTAIPMTIKLPKIDISNKSSAWSQAPEDAINHADEVGDNANQHTDDAINDVNSSVDNIYDVLGNKADADEFKDLQDQAQALQDSYQAFVSDGGQYQSDLSNLEDRATQLYMDLGDKLLQLSFVNTWFKAGEEGLSIGSADSSVKMLLSNNQLSFTDGGQTVAYFTAQSFYINKGAVVTSLQVNQHKLSRIDDNHTAFVFIG